MSPPIDCLCYQKKSRRLSAAVTSVVLAGVLGLTGCDQRDSEAQRSVPQAPAAAVTDKIDTDDTAVTQAEADPPAETINPFLAGPKASAGGGDHGNPFLQAQQSGAAETQPDQPDSSELRAALADANPFLKADIQALEQQLSETLASEKQARMSDPAMVDRAVGASLQPAMQAIHRGDLDALESILNGQIESVAKEPPL